VVTTCTAGGGRHLGEHVSSPVGGSEAVTGLGEFDARDVGVQRVKTLGGLEEGE
jgi:hypothetical protein